MGDTLGHFTFVCRDGTDRILEKTKKQRQRLFLPTSLDHRSPLFVITPQSYRQAQFCPDSAIYHSEIDVTLCVYMKTREEDTLNCPVCTLSLSDNGYCNCPPVALSLTKR